MQIIFLFKFRNLNNKMCHWKVYGNYIETCRKWILYLNEHIYNTHFPFEEILEILQKHWTKASSTLHVHKTSKIKDEFEHWNGAEHSFPGQPAPVCQNPHKQDLLPISKLNLPF